MHLKMEARSGLRNRELREGLHDTAGHAVGQGMRWGVTLGWCM